MSDKESQNKTSVHSRILDWETSSDPTALTNLFEFWPAWTIHIPMFLLGLFWGIRLRNPGFFVAANPGMENGGLFNYSKFHSLIKFPKENFPKSILLNPPHIMEKIEINIHENGFQFPFIIKPDFGERGRSVSLIQDQNELKDYLEHHLNELLILQEYVDKLEEYGVFVTKKPGSSQFMVESITRKIPLQILGDGENTIENLIKKHPRTHRYHSEIDQKKFAGKIPKKGEMIQLSKKGNHCKGAAFLDGSHLIQENVQIAFNQICGSVDGFYYGRLDVKVNSANDLDKADQIQILEINGANSEPIHMYSPGNSYFKSMQTLSSYFEKMALIARINLKNGAVKPNLVMLWKSYQYYRTLK